MSTSEAWRTKAALLSRGADLANEFCRANGLPTPTIVSEHPRWPFRPCAYYREGAIHIHLPRCGYPGSSGRAWSWPGYVTDRTPLGVVLHELGHHADVLFSSEADRYRGDFSRTLRERTRERPITSYAPDDGEWFAEIFRLFATNPDLLRKIRPATHAELARVFRPVESRPWEAVLSDAPARTIARARALIQEAPR